MSTRQSVKSGVLTVNVDEDFAVLTGKLSGIDRSQGVRAWRKIVFVTNRRKASTVQLSADHSGKAHCKQRRVQPHP